MSTIIATGFDRAWDGVYTLYYPDHWTNGTYWIYRDSFYWYISESPYLYGDSYIKAYLVFESVVDPRGSYIGTSGNPNGSVI